MRFAWVPIDDPCNVQRKTASSGGTRRRGRGTGTAGLITATSGTLE
jgi:hypothetical protein